MTTSKFQTKAYFRWLCSHIQIPDNGRTYDGMLEIMYHKEFVWVIGNDENRIEDGRDLRRFYLDSLHEKEGRDYESLHIDPVSFLEVLIGLSARIAFMVDGDSREWAWKLIENLRLHRLSDQLTERDADKIHDVLDTVIWRTYEINGWGGFFPLTLSDEDQTKVEIWYQMAAYVEENRASYGL
jgi:hypothetical protein